MATTELPPPEVTPSAAAPADRPRDHSFTFRDVLAVLASLRLTVVLFALAIFLIFAGTLAQKDHDIWYVLHEYFRTGVAFVEFRTFERLVQIFAKDVEWGLTGSFPFPGGKIIGLALLVNLFAAHAVRFKVAAHGRRLAIGLGMIALGILATALAIASGMNDTIESELSPEFCHGLWQVFRGLLAVLALAGANLLWYTYGRIRRVEWCVLLGVVLAIAGLATWLLVDSSARLNDSGLRILWQLAKGGGAGAVLLAGCLFVFRKRAGIVLLHAGVALIMLGQFWTAMTQKESFMRIAEGQTVNFSVDNRYSKFAVIDRSPPDYDRVTTISPSLLADNVSRLERIENDQLPFSFKVHRWLPNSRLRRARPNEPTPATAGAGLGNVAEEVPLATGDEGDEINFPAAYVELFSKDSGEPLGKSLGTYLLGIEVPEQEVEVDGRPYSIALRLDEIIYPYSLSLIDFRFDRYTGTNEPKNFSSLVRLRDPERNVDREVKIWMNNPLRYEGTTFYQADWDKVTEQGTVLQVVSNPGWMTPYVGCMLILTGLLAHFGMMLVRFVRRRAQEPNLPLSADGDTPSDPSSQSGSTRTFANWFPCLVLIVFGGYVLSKARMPESPPSEMQIDAFAALPVSYQGRIKPYDTLARNSLQFLSGRQELIGLPKEGWLAKLMGSMEKKPAIYWLLDVISGTPRAHDHRVFRVENLDLLSALGLEPRPGKWRYSLNEILDTKPGEFDRQLQLAEAQPEEERSLFQNKVLQLARKRNMYYMLFFSFSSPPLSTSTDEAEVRESLQRARSLIAQLNSGSVPNAVPPDVASVDWDPLMEAEFDWYLNRSLGQPTNPATMTLHLLLDAYASDNAASFNQHLADYRQILAGYEQTLDDNAEALKEAGAKPAEIYSHNKTSFEVFFNHFSPFFYCYVLYIVAFVLGVASWLGWTEPLRRSSIWLLWMTLTLHTFALVARIYISGRPPVTNLYSSAVFIGWGGVLLGLIFEAIYRLGLGNIVAAVGGFLSLLVAHFLSLDGDTLIVMQAVLDTQFWLATHVVCIALGYTTTLLAGMLGIAYVLLAHVFPVLEEEKRRQLTRMIYGTLCFAILFSFIGTILGGLWGDDSWGRFWGWDPKENGALIIVLYNALVLHARFGGLVKSRGLAALAVGGNIVVTWSWFGVNELNVGLHSYGESDSSTAYILLGWWMANFAIMALGAMPRRWLAALSPARKTPL